MARLTVADRSREELGIFVDDLYRALLGRHADAAGRAHYVERLANGMAASAVVDALVGSEEALARQRRRVLADVAIPPANPLFPPDYRPPGEAGRCYLRRLRSGFLDRYCSGPLVLDVGYAGYDNSEGKAALPHAIGIDLDYPGYDGTRLPFEDGSVDTVFSSHCLEHILADHAAIRDWFRVLKVGGFIVCMVPSQALYEKRRFLPSRFNGDHKRFYTPATLLRSFEDALVVNSYRVRHLAENDTGFNYTLGPDTHSDGAYEIELVMEKIFPPAWELA